MLNVKCLGNLKHLVVAGLMLCFSHGGWAEQAPLVLRDNVLTIPQAVIIDGDTITHFRNIELFQDASGDFAITSATDGALANVESVDILRQAERVDAVAKGFRSACVSIEPAAVSYLDGEFIVAIPESVPTGDVCTAQAIRFYTITTLPTQGLSPGEYSVSVNGVKTDFML